MGKGEEREKEREVNQEIEGNTESEREREREWKKIGCIRGKRKPKKHVILGKIMNSKTPIFLKYNSSLNSFTQ